MKDKEIEIKLLFNNKKEIINRLKPDIKFLRRVDVFDRYYCINESGIKNNNDFFRIRKINGDIELTYKGRVKDKKRIVSKVELTIKISSLELMEKILMNLGLKKISEHYNKKEYWSFNRAEIVFVKFIKPASLEFMEVEAPSEKEIEGVLKKISDYVSDVNEDMFFEFDRANQKKRTI